MANTANIQILRSYGTATPSKLLDGQLAYSFVSNTLFIGSNNKVISIGDPSTKGVAQSAYLQANTGTVLAQAGYDTANSAQVIANTKVSKSGDTMTGKLILSGNTTSLKFSNGSSIFGNYDNNAITISANSDTNTTGFYAGLKNGGIAQVYSNGRVEITTDTGAAGAVWTFDKEGNLTFPGNGLVETFSNVINIWTSGNNSYTQIQNDSVGNGSSYVWLENGNVYIETTDSGGYWTFGSDGSIKFPDGSKQYVGYNAEYNQGAYAKANSASANTIFTQGVDATQNTNIASTDNKMQYAYGQANTGRVLAQAAYIQANVTMGVDTTQNTRLTIIEATDVTQNTWLAATDGKMQNAYFHANGAFIKANSAYDTANSATANTIIIQGVDLTQNTNIAATNQYATSAFSTANNAYTKANNALANTTGTFAGTLTVTGNVIANSFQTAGASGNISGANFVYANTFVASNSYIFSDGTIQTTAASANLATGAYNQANTATVLAQAAYNQANVTIGVDATQNTRLTVIEGTDSSQNVRLDYSNSAITIIQGVDVGQNARMTIIDGVNVSQNVRLDFSNTAITIIQGVDVGQNSRMTIIEGTDSSQNVRLDYSNTAITIIQGVDATQNTNISNKVNLTGSLNQTVSGNVTIGQNLIVAGNLIITGNISSQNVQELSVADPLIVLGIGNYISDTKDIGFAAHYNDGSNAHTGLIRDSATKEYYIFQGYTPEVDANNNVDINHASFQTAKLNANEFHGNVIANTVVVNGGAVVVDGINLVSVNNTQNTRLTVIEGTNSSQNTRIDYSNAAITIIQGVDLTQNTNISATNQYAATAYARANSSIANTGSQVMTGTLNVSNSTASTSNTTGALIVAGGVGISGNLWAANAWVRGTPVLTQGDLATVTYTANYITMNPAEVPVGNVGTATSRGYYNFGNVSSIQTYGDYDLAANTGFYSVNDESFANGTPGHVEYIGFTGVSAFNRVVLNINYTALSGHIQDIDIFNYSSNTWDTLGVYSGSGSWQQFALGVIDDVPYINTSTGNVTIRNYHVSAGSNVHRTWIDYVALEQSITGGQGPRGSTGATGATGATGPVDPAAFNQANTATVLAQASYDQANVTIGVDVTQNTRLTVIEGTDVSQNVRLDYSNTTITIIQGVDATQNTNISLKYNTAGGTITGNVIVTGNVTPTIDNVYSLGSENFRWKDVFVGPGSINIDGLVLGNNNSTLTMGGVTDISIPDSTIPNLTDLANTANSASANTIIIQGVDVGQNSRMTIIQGVDSSQNVRLDYSNAAITIIQGTDVTQNSLITIIQGVDLTQNTNIAATDNKMSSAYNQANTGTVLAQASFDLANTISGGSVDATARGIANSASANTIIIQGVDVSQNANIVAVQSLANTDFTTLTVTAGVYGNTDYVPVITLAANGRITSIVNTAITGSGGGGGGVSASGYLANSVIFANSTGYLSNTNGISFYGANNTLVVANISVPTIYTTLNGIVFPDGTSQSTAASESGIDQLARDTANTANGVAQASYAQANLTIGVDASQNVRLDYSNSAITIIQGTNASQNVRLDFSNTRMTISDGVNASQNTRIDYSNTAITVIDNEASAAYDTANTARNNANSAYFQANGAFIKANAAYAQANVTAGGLITANANNFSTNSVASAAYDTANTARNNANSAYFQANGAFIRANAAFAQANVTAGGLITANANNFSTNSVASAAYDTANTARNNANSAYFHANGAFIRANAAFDQANVTAGGLITANANNFSTNSYAAASYDTANTARNNANSAYFQANGAFIRANAAFDKANAAIAGVANFGSIIVSGSPDVIANVPNAQLTFVAGSGMTITSVGTSNTITFASSGGGGGGATITDDTTSAGTRYVTMTTQSSGSQTIANTSTTKLYFQPSTGTLSATIFSSLSDETQKININVIQNSLEITENINGVTFDWVDGSGSSVGLIAQDVEKYFPQLINIDDTGTKSLNYNGVIGVLVEAVKDLSERVKKLEGK